MPEILTNVWTFVYGALCIAVAVIAAIVLLRDARDRRERDAENLARVNELVALEAVRTKAHRNYIKEQEEKRADFDVLPTIEVDEADEGAWYDAKVAQQVRESVEGKGALDDVIVR